MNTPHSATLAPHMPAGAAAARRRERRRAAPALLACGCGLAGLALAWHYPLLQPWLAPVFFATLVAAFFRFPVVWLVAVPAGLPLLGLAPWSGWLSFEEWDLLVLAAAAAGYARHTLGAPVPGGATGNTTAAPPPPALRFSRRAAVLAALFAASTVLALLRGFADAGGFAFGWFQGYHEPMNSVRLARSFAGALLLLPLWNLCRQQDPQRSEACLTAGMVLGLTVAALATVWERAAFTGLMDFSTDYRTTGPFWEMHVGGAALDGFLALTVPFAVHALLGARAPARFGLAAAACALAAYACLTTFSRGVFLAVPVALVLLYLLRMRQQVRLAALAGTPANAGTGLLQAMLLVAGFGAAAANMFQTSGYRGTAALLGTVVLSLPLAGLLRGMPFRQWAGAAAAGLVFMGAAAITSQVVPKAAYLAYALAWGAAAWQTGAIRRQGQASARTRFLALASFVATAAGVVLVATHWGYAPATAPAVVAAGACILLIAVAASTARAPWPQAMAWQASVAGAMGVALATIGVFGGGAYMGDRFTQGGRDLDNRFGHWKIGTDMLLTPADWWLGKGLGRYPANNFLVGDPKNRPGDYRLQQQGDNGYLTLTGGLLLSGENQLVRVSQRIAVPGLPVRVTGRVRTSTDAALQFEICEKHLLYHLGCLKGAKTIRGAPEKWQAFDLALEGGGLSRGPIYAPRLIAFSMALDSLGGKADLDQIALRGPDGLDLLANGDFSDGLAHWFFSSDKNHLPWHMKNLFLHVLFEQGLAGLLVWTLLVAGALLRLGIGRAAAHPLAPVMAASLTGFLVVGLFDSLLDVPRVAMLFYLLVLAAWTLASARPRPREAPGASTGFGSLAGSEPAGPHDRHAARTNARRPFPLGWTLLVATVLAIGGVAAALLPEGRSFLDLGRKTPAEAVRFLKAWVVERQPSLSGILLPALERVQVAIERPPPAGPLPTLGKGQQAGSLDAQRFAPSGEPLPTPASGASVPAPKPDLEAGSAAEIVRAVQIAKAGQTILVRPGRYRINTVVPTGNAGTAQQPITVRAANPGEAVIEFDTVEGFHVTQPYWVIENLTIRGVCRRDSDCEHAFHVVGAARGVVLRNNRVEDFNAHIKVNGADGKWPDNGLAQYNTLTNGRNRQTENPVTPFDLVAASGWQVLDNLVTDFVKTQGNQVSYGVFMKGAGDGGRIERNLIVCTSSGISQPGNRVGLSWGAGSAQSGSCRDGKCTFDFTAGVAANNVIAHCNDAGIDVNRSRQITLGFNTLVNTAGILVRGRSEDVQVYGNLMEGRIRSHDSLEVQQAMNDVVPLKNVLADPDSLVLNHRPTAPSDVRAIGKVPVDFCNQPRSGVTRAGATSGAPLPCAASGR